MQPIFLGIPKSGRHGPMESPDYEGTGGKTNKGSLFSVNVFLKEKSRMSLWGHK